MSSGLWSGVSGLALNAGLWGGNSGVWSGSPGLLSGPSGGGGGGGFLSAIGSLGWKATYSGSLGPIASLELVAGFGQLTAEDWSGSPVTRPITVTRNGFGDTGAATTFNDTIYATQRERLPSAYFPAVNGSPTLDAGPFTFTANGVILSERVFAGEVVAGCTNNSTAISPAPLGAWTSVDRQVIGNSVTVSAVFAHWAARNGRQIRCCEFYATDGTNTVASGKITAPTLSSFPGDFRNYPHWVGTLNTTTLTNGAMIRVYCKAWPWVGAVATPVAQRDGSVVDMTTADSQYTARYFAFSDQYYLKQTAAPLLACVKAVATGTPQVSTTLATVQANCYGSFNGAVTALAAANGGTLENCIVYISDTTTPVVLDAISVTRQANVAALLVTRDPANPRVTANITLSSTQLRIGIQSALTAPLVTSVIHFRDLNVTWGVNNIAGTAGQLSEMRFEDCTYDQTVGNLGTSGLLTSAWSVLAFYGTSIANYRGSSQYKVATAGAVKHRGTLATVTGTWQAHMHTAIGCRFTACDQGAGADLVTANSNWAVDGQFRWHTDFLRAQRGSVTHERVGAAFATFTLGAAVVNCLYENIFAAGGGSGAGQLVNLSGDGGTTATSSVYNAVIMNNSMIGFNHTGASNSFYDDTDNTTTSTFSASGGPVGVPAAGQQVLTLTVAASAVPNPGDIIGCRQAIVGMTSDLTFVSGTGTIIGSTWTVSGATTTFTNRALSVGTVPDARARTHSYIAWKGNISARAASKGDIFNSWTGGPGTNNMSIAQATARQGNWEWDTGVGAADNNFTWLSNFFKLHYGINTKIAARNVANVDTNAGSTETIIANVPQNYTTWAASIGPPTNEAGGVGGGDYRVNSSHPAKNLCGANLYTSHDLNAVARVAGTANSAGCYV